MSETRRNVESRVEVIVPPIVTGEKAKYLGTNAFLCVSGESMQKYSVD